MGSDSLRIDRTLLHICTGLKPSYVHCQVPCGIFDDPRLAADILEACATIRKAMVQLNELEGSNLNQSMRWVGTKDEHCDKIIVEVNEYCLCQRVKPEGVFESEGDYVDALKAHHKLMQAAMKCKQTVSVTVCDALEHAAEDVLKMYLAT